LRYFFEISYKGTNYHGWQIQANALSIQQVIQEKLSLIAGENVEITGSGRTDTGVHARQQFFHADFNKELNCEDTRYHTNAVLPNDIVIHSIRKVQENAHTRFDAVSRAYSYEIIPTKNPFSIGQAYIYHKILDIEKLNAAAKVLIGKHDFESFSKVKTQVNNFNCEVFKAFWQRQGPLTCFKIEANRFLRGMVRAIVGTLLLVNENKLAVGDVSKILAGKDRSSAGRSVPPEGLYLQEIKYPEQIYIN
jgi:tRNA pseudouridine38-40 synthase